MSALLLRDVTLRDGLQDEAPIPTGDKVALYEALVLAGIAELELTSFVRPDRVPAMADAAELAAAVGSTAPGPVRWALALNTRGAERAMAAGIDHLQFVVSVSEPHSVENAGRTPAEALAELRSLVQMAAGEGAVVEVTLATAFGCPFAGPVAERAVLDVLEQALDAGVSGVGLGDTIGTAVPTEVRSLVTAAVALAGEVSIGAHLHDTRGLALTNALEAIEAGAARRRRLGRRAGRLPVRPGRVGQSRARGPRARAARHGRRDRHRPRPPHRRRPPRLPARRSRRGQQGRLGRPRYANTPYGLAASSAAQVRPAS